MRNSSWKFHSWVVAALMLLHTVLPSMTALAQAVGPGLEVRVISPTLREVAPGHVFSFSVQVEQTTGRDEVLEEGLILPEGWQAVVPPMPFTLPSGERAVRILAVLVPANAPAGRYEIGYTVRSRRDYALQYKAVIAVQVLAVRKLAFVIEEKPDSVIAGEGFRAQLRLLNQGNIPAQVRLSAESSRPGASQRIEPAAAAIPAGESLPVIVTGSTSAHERRSFTHYLRVVAETEEADPQRATATFGIEIIPLAIVKGGADNVFPTRLDVRLTGDEGTSGAQVTWEGGGDLDDSGQRRLDFLLQGPDGQAAGIFGLRDEMRLNYYSPNVDLRMGDQSYSLSSLTDYYHYGRGIGADFRLSQGFGAGAYQLRERWETSRESVRGAYLSRETGLGRLKLNYARRSKENDEDHLWSAEIGCPLVKRTAARPYDARLSAEVAGSSSTRTGIGTDKAYRAELTGSYGKDTNYLLRVIHAGPDYMGYYRDSQYYDGTLAFPVSGRVRGNLHFAEWRQNQRRDPLKGTAPDERLARLSFDYRFANGYSASLGYSDFARRDLLRPENSLVHERPFRFGLSRAAGVTSWSAEYFLGNYRSESTELNCEVSGGRLHLAYRPSATRLFTLFGGWRSNSDGSFLLASNSHLGASVLWRPTDALELAGWYTSHNLNDASRVNHQGQLSARYLLPGDRAWELKALTGSPAGGKRSMDYLLSYSVPIGLPLPRKKTTGDVKGEVYDARRPDHPGIPNVIVRLNDQAAITDRHGRFAFTHLKPGPCQVKVDQKSISLNRITVQSMPMPVTVTGGQTARVSIGVLPAAQLTGSVMLRPADWRRADTDQAHPVVVGDPNKKTVPTVSRGLSNVLVELRNGSDTLRRVTDGQGTFTFDRLQPGRWHLKVYGGNLPAYHRLETAEMDFELAGEETAMATVNVLPLARPIKILPASTEILRVEVSSLK